MASVRMLLSVSESHRGALDDIAAAATAAGMDVDACLPEIGVVSGLIEADGIDRLRTIAGVEDVQPDATFSVAPSKS